MSKSNQSINTMTPAATLSQIISADPQAGHLLKAIGLDPANYREKSLQSVCRQLKWSEVEVLGWIKKNFVQNKNSVNGTETAEPDFGNKLSKWCAYLENKKMVKTMDLLSEINKAFPRVRQIHGNQYPWLKNMQPYLEQFNEKIKLYYKFEKTRFFPLVKKLNASQEDVLDGTVHNFKRCSTIIEKDQKQLQQYINSIQIKGCHFMNPDGACSTMRILNQNLEMLFNDVGNQFIIEREKILPGVRQKIKGILTGGE